MKLKEFEQEFIKYAQTTPLEPHEVAYTNVVLQLIEIAKKADYCLGWISKDAHSGCDDNYCVPCQLAESIEKLDFVLKNIGD